MQRAPGIPHALCFLGEGFMHTSGDQRRGNAEVCLMNTIATLSAVIVRESGRSSIPETLMIESRGRGVLDRPVKPDDDNSLWSETRHTTQRVVPANAGTHNRRGARFGAEGVANAFCSQWIRGDYGSACSVRK